jgi:hypothetical protein
MVRTDEEEGLTVEEEEDEEDEEPEVEHIDGENTPLDEDTFGMALCSLTRDSHFLAEGFQWPRCGRLMTTLLLLVFTISLQVAILTSTKKYVSAKGVHDIRIAYGLFEETIYQCHGPDGKGNLNETQCRKTKYGNVRGHLDVQPPLDVQRSRLQTMTESDQGDVCRIPLSQPFFFYLILLIWTLTCFSELRKSLTLSLEICKLKTVKSMSDALDRSTEEEGSGEAVIIGLTCAVKIFMLFLLVVRVCITVYLLWVGCRWLLSTNRFDDLIMNSIALEFILLLKELVHATLVPKRNAIELSKTTLKLAKSDEKIKPGCQEFTGTVSILFLAMFWVWLYMYKLQEVLPEYQWDVHDVCVQYIKERFNVSTR